MQPRVAIVYLCWYEVDYVQPVSEALFNLTYPKDRTKVFIATDASNEDLKKKIQTHFVDGRPEDGPDVQVVELPENYGFAGNNNVVIQRAIEEGFDYVFIHNGDLRLHPKAISRSVRLVEQDPSIASVQSLVLYWNNHRTVNTSGGMFHVAGYGYARDNLKSLDDVDYDAGEEIAYASGAASLFRCSDLKEVGLLEEGFFMYHEDLELGLRLLTAGKKNVLAPGSWAYHDYSFSRNPKKFAWMELYRLVVVKGYYKLPTLLLLAPVLFSIEIATWLLAAKGGWISAKFYQYRELVKPRTWKLVWKMRRRTKRLRQISDREILRHVTGKIHGQETESWVVQKIANPLLDVYVRCLRVIVRW